MATIYYEQHGDISRLKGKQVAILGYGSQGHAHALNLKASGIDVVVGLRKDSPSVGKAERSGLRVLGVSEAAAKADITMMTLPDESMAQIYREHVAPNLQPGKYLAVAHGFNIHFGVIRPPADVNVFMVAPKGPGHTVRAHYEEGRGVPSLVAVHQDPTGDTLQIALAYAAGIGAGRAGIIETNFREETETDLFGEQTVLCGGIVELIKAGYETLTEAGYAPEMAYFECLHETKLIVDLIYEGGIANMNYSISNNAEYGEYVTGPKVIGPESKQAMKECLARIQSGEYARDFILENRAGAPTLNAKRRLLAEHDIEKVGEKLRAMMPWIKKNKLVDTSRN